MDFAEALQANRFLVEQIAEQARRQGNGLSEAELHQLRSPDCGHTVDEDAVLDASLPESYSAWGLRAKVAPLLRSAYLTARSSKPSSAAAFQSAYKALRGSPFLLGNLRHSDVFVLKGIKLTGARAIFELWSTVLSFFAPLSTVPPDSMYRPMTIFGTLLAACAIPVALIALLFRAGWGGP